MALTYEQAEAAVLRHIGEQGASTDGAVLRGVRKDGAWLVTWDAKRGQVPMGAPSYVVLDRDGSVHEITWRESLDDKLQALRAGR